MQLNNKAYLLCILAVVASMTSSASEGNEPSNERVYSDMMAVVLSYEHLTAKQIEKLTDTMEVIRTLEEELSKDKSRSASTHLRVYLDEHLYGRAVIADKEFELVNDTFAWALRNFLSVSPLSEQERRRWNVIPNLLSMALQEGIPQIYPNVPEGLTVRLIEAALPVILNSHGKRWGNYFYPEALYPPAEEALLHDTLLQSIIEVIGNRSDRYDAVSAIIESPDSTAAEREMHIGFFIEREAFFLTDRLKNIVSQLGDGRWKGYTEPPRELLEAWGNLATEMQVEGEAHSEQLIERGHHTALLRELMAETGVEVQSGVVHIPHSLLDSIADMSLEESSNPERVQDMHSDSFISEKDSPLLVDEKERQSVFLSRWGIISLGLLVLVAYVILKRSTS